jgi:hypothetical protein
LVGSDGSRLSVDGPKQLAISSIQQQLRRTAANTRAGDEQERATDHRHSDAAFRAGGQGGKDKTVSASTPTGAAAVGGGGTGAAVKNNSYSWYRLEIVNRSITDEAKREAIRAHLVWLADKLDEEALDHQLLTLKYELLAATDSKLTEDLRARAQTIQANKLQVEEEP